MSMTLMSAGQNICKLLGIDQDSVTDLFFTEHVSAKVKHKGILLKTNVGCVIVPDIKNAEKMFIFSTTKSRDIAFSLYQHAYTQAQIAGMMKITQPTISRILGGVKNTDEKDCI